MSRRGCVPCLFSALSFEDPRDIIYAWRGYFKAAKNKFQPLFEKGKGFHEGIGCGWAVTKGERRNQKWVSIDHCNLLTIPFIDRDRQVCIDMGRA